MHDDEIQECTTEMHRLREALEQTMPVNVVLWDEPLKDYPQVYRNTENDGDEIVICYLNSSQRASGGRGTIRVYVFAGYPSIAAHSGWHGDAQLLRLLDPPDEDIAALGYGDDMPREWLVDMLNDQLLYLGGDYGSNE